MHLETTKDYKNRVNSDCTANKIFHVVSKSLILIFLSAITYFTASLLIEIQSLGQDMSFIIAYISGLLYGVLCLYLQKYWNT